MKALIYFPWNKTWGETEAWGSSITSPNFLRKCKEGNDWGSLLIDTKCDIEITFLLIEVSTQNIFEKLQVIMCYFPLNEFGCVCQILQYIRKYMLYRTRRRNIVYSMAWCEITERYIYVNISSPALDSQKWMRQYTCIYSALSSIKISIFREYFPGSKVYTSSLP